MQRRLIVLRLSASANNLVGDLQSAKGLKPRLQGVNLRARGVTLSPYSSETEVMPCRYGSWNPPFILDERQRGKNNI
jgi:hypothetical protein